MWPFRCKHPAGRLGPHSPTPTVTPIDEDFEKVTFHLHCWECGKKVDVSCTSLVDGVDAFLNRKLTTPPL
uniref:Uncharacterized protein n=1 Tax=viral metagenome TaxID=1070528 RepID=A0A6M3M5F9_9ZZZZ